MIKNITNLGDAAVYCDFGNEIDQETNLNVIKYFKNLKEVKVKGVTPDGKISLSRKALLKD